MLTRQAEQLPAVIAAHRFQPGEGRQQLLQPPSAQNLDFSAGNGAPIGADPMHKTPEHACSP